MVAYVFVANNGIFAFCFPKIRRFPSTLTNNPYYSSILYHKKSICFSKYSIIEWKIVTVVVDIYLSFFGSALLMLYKILPIGYIAHILWNSFRRGVLRTPAGERSSPLPKIFLLYEHRIADLLRKFGYFLAAHSWMTPTKETTILGRGDSRIARKKRTIRERKREHQGAPLPSLEKYYFSVAVMIFIDHCFKRTVPDGFPPSW